MRRVALLTCLGLLVHPLTGNAQVNYAWTSHFDMGTTESSVLATDGTTLFGLTCGMPTDTYIMGVELESHGAPIAQGPAPTVVQVILDGKAYSASLTGGSGTATTLGDKTSLANLASALAETTSPYFQVQIPALDWARTFSTQSARQALHDPAKPNVSQTVLDPCLNDAPPAQSAQSSPSPTPVINPVTGPSFSCPQPRDPLAQLICTTPALALLDMRFVQTYEALYQQVGPAGDPAIRRADLDFGMAVRSKCGIGLSQASNPSPTPLPPAPVGSADCVAPAYQEQIDIWTGQLLGPAAQEAARPIADQVALQGRLQTLGFLPAQSQLDGVFGHGTRAAIIRWQTNTNRVPTGLLGDDDAQALLGGSTPSPVATLTPATAPSASPSSPPVETAWAPYIQYAACMQLHGFSLQTFVTQGVAPTDAIAAAVINLCAKAGPTQTTSATPPAPNASFLTASGISSATGHRTEQTVDLQQQPPSNPTLSQTSVSTSSTPDVSRPLDLSLPPTPKKLLFCAGYIGRADAVASDLLPDPMTLPFFSITKKLLWQAAEVQKSASTPDAEVAPYLDIGMRQVEHDSAEDATIASPMKSEMVQNIVACESLSDAAPMLVPNNETDFVTKNFDTPTNTVDQQRYADRISRIAYCSGYLTAASNATSSDSSDTQAISSVAKMASKTASGATADRSLISNKMETGATDERQDSSAASSTQFLKKLEFCLNHMTGWQPQ
jgi:peptidoglycan hydrolase-like protein with peptidoglycan-binding domain